MATVVVPVLTELVQFGAGTPRALNDTYIAPTPLIVTRQSSSIVDLLFAVGLVPHT